MPILANVYVYERDGQRRIQAGDGRYSVDSPCDLPLLTCDGSRLSAAVAACTGDPVVTTTDGNVMVRSGKVRARIPLNPTPYPLREPVAPGATHITAVGNVLKRLEPFAADDASRPWATAVCLSGGYAYATNNVAIVRCPLPADVPTPVNIPATVIPAVTQRGDVTDIGCDGHSVTFYYGDGSWVTTGLIEGEWPTATADRMFAGITSDWVQVHESLSGLLATAVKLSQDKHPKVEFSLDGFKTTDGAFDVEDVGELPAQGKVAARMAGLVFGVATEVQWHTPKEDVHAFRCDDLIGVMGGTR